MSKTEEIKVGELIEWNGCEEDFNLNFDESIKYFLKTKELKVKKIYPESNILLVGDFLNDIICCREWIKIKEFPTLQEWADEHNLYVAVEPSGIVKAFVEKPHFNTVTWNAYGYEITKFVQKQSGENWENSLVIPKSLQPKHEPYTEPNFDWIKNNVSLRSKSNKNLFKIQSIFVEKNKIIVRLKHVDYDYTLKDLFEGFQYEDGTPFGKLVEEK